METELLETPIETLIQGILMDLTLRTNLTVIFLIEIGEETLLQDVVPDKNAVQEDSVIVRVIMLIEDES